MAASDGRLMGFASGAFGAVVAGAVTHPIDLVKVSKSFMDPTWNKPRFGNERGEERRKAPTK